VLAAGLADINATVAQREAALEAALLAEAPRLERGLGLLAALGAVAPLLGLLGTVTGMIATFETIAVHGTGNPRLLSGGIGIALITTQAGLLIAVPVLLAHALIGRVIERRLLSLEGMAVALLAREQADRPSVEGGR
jgi:biopolymer transport protein ExbB